MPLLRSPADRLPLRGRKQWATNLLLCALATEYLGASITVPIMAQFAASFEVDRGIVGLVFSVGSFATLLSDMWLPRVSDSYGRKPAIVLSLVGSSVAYFMEAASPTFTFLLFSAFIGGMFGGTPPVAVAYISDIFSPSERPQYIGLVPAVVSACFVLGPTIGGFISNSSNSFRIPITVSAVVCGALALPIVLFFVPDSKHLLQTEEKKDINESIKEQELSDTRRRSVVDESSNLLDATTSDGEFGYAGPWKDFRCWICLFISLFNNMVFSCLVTTLPLVLEESSFGLASEHDAVFYTGLVLGSGAITQAFGMAFLFNIVQSKVGLIKTISLGTSLSFLGYVFISFQNTVLGLGLGFAMFTLGNCLTRPGYTSFLTNIVPTEYTARAIAMPTIASSVAGLISPIVSTLILARTNHEVLYRLASSLLLVQLALILFFLRGEKEEVVVDEKAVQAPKEEYLESRIGHMTEDQLAKELIALLKHRNYRPGCPKTQKIIMAIMERSFPYLNCDTYREECSKLLGELKISDCEKEQITARRRSIARGASCKFAASQLTQLGE